MKLSPESFLKRIDQRTRDPRFPNDRRYMFDGPTAFGQTKPVTPATRGQPRGGWCAKITSAALETIEDYESTSIKIGVALAKFLPSFISKRHDRCTGVRY
jgi:hypothetical protein